MEQQVVRFTGHDKKTGNSRRGAWALHIFEADNGDKYQTFDGAIANAAFALYKDGRPAAIEFEVEFRDDFANNVLKSVSAADGSAVGGGADANSATGPSGTSDQSAKQAQVRWQWAVNASIAAQAAGLVQLQGLDQLFALAERLDASSKARSSS